MIKQLLMILVLIIFYPASSLELDISRLSDCESLDGWTSVGGVQLVKGVGQDGFAVSADMPAGKVGAVTLDYADTGIDLSEAHTLAFWWKIEGDGLRSFMVKVRNYPVAEGMEAIYTVWEAGEGELPGGWRHAAVVLSKPRYDNWGQRPDKQSRYIAFRTTTSSNAHVRLFVDEVVALPPTFHWEIKDPVMDRDEIALMAWNLTESGLSVNFGSSEKLLKQVYLPPKGELRFHLPLTPFASQSSQLQPFRSMPVQIWAEIADLEETRMDKTVKLVKEGKLPGHPRLLFNREGVEKLKARIENCDWADARWNGIKKNADRIMGESIELPPRGGNWWHWYACPEHGAALRTGKKIGKWQWEHICPVDNQVFRGDPDRPERDYDGCVISGAHGRLARSVLDLGIAYQVTGDGRYADKAREILLAYTDRYLSYPLHTIRGEERIGGGRVGPQTLDESTWLIPICQGADLIWNRLDEDDRNIIAQKMMLPAAEEVILPHHIGVHNIQCWKNSAVGLVGFLLGDDELINQAIYNPDRGYWTQMQKGVMPDGIWWEGAWGYHFYTLSALWSLTEAARNCGIDLYCDQFKSMFDGPLKFAMPDLRLPAFNDSGEVNLKGRASIYELAFARYREPRYVNLISTGDRRNDFALRFGMDELPPEVPIQWESMNYPDSGYAILARGEGDQATWFCIKYGPHGGGHGHPDKLNFVLYSGGQIIAPDPGTARYGVPIQRGWYRTTLAHNTLVVDENSQERAEGRCLDFGSEDGVDYVVAEAGNIYDDVRFIRSAALIHDRAIVFIDQIRCDRERLLDVVYHNQGKWDVMPDGKEWTPPDKPGYGYLRDATIRENGENVTLSVNLGEDRRTAIGLESREPTQVITASGVGRHAGHRVPTVIFRRRAKETAFIWQIGLDGQMAQISFLPVQNSDGSSSQPAVALAVQIRTSDGKERVLTVNPDQLLLDVQIPGKGKHQVVDAFAVR